MDEHGCAVIRAIYNVMDWEGHKELLRIIYQGMREQTSDSVC